MVILMGYDTVGKRSRWLERAESGDVYAQYELAQSYCCGIGEGKFDNKEALKWWCVSAKKGYTKSQIMLARLYENVEQLNDVSIPYNPSMSYMWYKLAKKHSSEEGRENLLRLEKVLNEKQIEKGENLLSDWKNAPCGQEKME